MQTFFDFNFCFLPQESDISLAKLEATKEILEAESEKLYAAIIQLTQSAKQAVAADNREKALVLLRRKKRLSKTLNDKEVQIANTELLTEQLLDSGSHQAIMEAFAFANSVLKKNVKKLENVESTIGQVEETLDDISSLTSEINRPINTNNVTVVDDDELEQELDDMLKQDEEQSDLARQLDNLEIHENRLSSDLKEIERIAAEAEEQQDKEEKSSKKTMEPLLEA